MYHNNTLRRYTAALLNIFNDLEVQHKDSKGNLITKKVPIVYKSREKSTVLDKYESEQLTKGNLNILPRASMAISSIQRAEDRISNKFNKIVQKENRLRAEFAYNSMPYDVYFEVHVMCRGINEACMIFEQVAPKFNPTISLDVYDTDFLEEPTRVLVKLLDINMDYPEFDETSTNLVTVNIMLNLAGYIYQPLKELPKIKETIFTFRTNKSNSDAIIGWDKETDKESYIYDDGRSTFKIIDIVPKDVLRIGANQIDIIMDTKKHIRYKYEWTVVYGDCLLRDKHEKNPILNIKSKGEFCLKCKVVDSFDNYMVFEKSFLM